MFSVEIRSRFPKFGKKLLVQCGFEISDSLRASCSSLGADHSLNHLNVVRAPERKVFVVFQQRLGQLKFFVALLKVREYLKHGLSALLISFLLLLFGTTNILGR